MAETTESKETPPVPAATTPPAAPPVKTKQEQFIEDAELPDSSYEQEYDGMPVATPKAETPPEPEPETPVEPPKHSARTVRLAQQLGLSREEIASVTPEQLDEEIYARNLEVLALARANLAAGRATPPAPAPSPPDEFDLGMTPEEEAEWDPRHIKVLKKLSESGKKLKELEAKLQQREQQEAIQQSAARLDAYDTAFAAREEIFGKGTAFEIDRNGDAFAKRQAVSLMVEADVSNAPESKKIERAIKRLYGDKVPGAKQDAEIEKKLAENKKKFAAGTVAKPTHRAAAKELPKGEESARRALAEKFRENGWNDDSFEGIEEKNLPE